MFNELPHDNLGLEWEPCHQLVYLIDPIPQIRKWAPKFFHVHGKDATVRWDVIREHGVFGKVPFVQMRTPGFGDSDWTRVISEAGITAALANGSHENYLAQPAALAEPATITDGNAILGHIFGTKDVSRQAAASAAQKTGIDPAILRKMLPVADTTGTSAHLILVGGKAAPAGSTAVVAVSRLAPRPDASLNFDGSLVAFSFPRVLSGAVNDEDLRNNSEISAASTAAAPRAPTAPA